jgi:hypothetical protein
VLQKITKFLEQKEIKYSLIILSIIGLAACIIIMQEQIIDFIINIVETKLLHRELKSLNKWKDYLFGQGYGFSVFIVLLWYFYIRKNTAASFGFLFASFGVYLYTYKIFSVNHGAHDLLRFPIVVLVFVIIFHIINYRQYFAPVSGMTKNINLFFTKNKFLNSSHFIFIFGGFLGSMFFIYIFGTAILDFSYTAWLMSGVDLSQHYLGWKMFRNSSWYFPIGLMDNIVYPFKISMIYTDSIPLFAVFFKLLSPALPENFQYFGLFGITCYILQGGCGALIIRKIGGNTFQSIIGSLLFTMSTVMAWRLYFHTSLAAHFIILLCILACLEYKNHDLKKRIIIWSCLLALSASIHLYFVPMVMVFMFFCMLKEYLLLKNLKHQCIVTVSSLLILIGTMFCLGVFNFIKDESVGQLGTASANLNSFVNPYEMSRFIKDMPLISDYPHEGNSYLGLGIILLSFVILILTLYQKNKKEIFLNMKTGLAPYITGTVIFFLLLSLSPVITFNQYKLFTYPMFYPVERLWSIFRSTGRFTWPVIYIIITICIWWTITRFSAKKSLIILCLVLLIQWVDLMPWFTNKGNIYKKKGIIWQTELASETWGKLANDYRHILFTEDTIKWDSFLDLAGNYKLTVNDTYLARTNLNKVNGNKQKELAYLINNGPRDNTIYVFQNEEQAFKVKESGINFYIIDGVIIGINTKKEYLDNLEFYPLR